MHAPLARALGSFILLLPLACGSPQTSSQRPARETGIVRGEVIERTEGFSSRPSWADESQPITRKADAVRATGYVKVSASQRKEAATLAADSYARAELVRFLSVRVFGLLKDQQADDGARALSESVSERAGGWLEKIPISARYWERRRDQKQEELHVWSRIDLSQAQMGELLAELASQEDKLAFVASNLRTQLDHDWQALSDPQDWHKDGEPLPEGALVPEWAKGGDQKLADSFELVCHGIAADAAALPSLGRRASQPPPPGQPARGDHHELREARSFQRGQLLGRGPRLRPRQSPEGGIGL